MKKIEFLIGAVSLGFTIVVATLFGIVGSLIAGPFWAWFSLSILIQIIAFFIINSFLIKRDTISIEENDLKILENLSKFTINIGCAYCQTPNNVAIQLNQRNTFKCESCNQVSSIAMQFTATTLTTPINSVALPVIDSEPVQFNVRS